MLGILYIYLTRNNDLIYKFTKNNNDLYIGDLNCYDHKLIFKAKISGNQIVPLYSLSDYFGKNRKKDLKWKMKKIIEIIMR